MDLLKKFSAVGIWAACFMTVTDRPFFQRLQGFYLEAAGGFF